MDKFNRTNVKINGISCDSPFALKVRPYQITMSLPE